MSKRNSQEAKRAARERLLAERQKQKKKDKVRRQLTVAGSVVAILAIAAGIGVAVANMDSSSGEDTTDWGAVRSQLDDDGSGEAEEGKVEYPTDAPANASGEDGLTVLIGDPDAVNTITLYEDPRCPSCANFEQGVGETIHEDIEEGLYNVEFVFGTFLDDRLGGSGSRNAVAALGAALDVSPEAFQGLHQQLYMAENHPSEQTDEFGDDARLIELAQNVPDLKGNADFEAAVNDSTFAAWALQMSDKFQADPEVEGTPTIKVNGTVVEAPRTPEAWDAMLATTLVEGEPDAEADADADADAEEGADTEEETE
ncbi:thioredoxin domain-containing protein [Streptomyces sp. NBRC 109706]|uniref:thioredoxin domain-containing protein n=1 Tax=Streptomyces sp. NBRC 109706 TaxID=1550035 RepID=UPI00082F8FDA|nr:thioredoxin domain-containing protein [Streptomyces sp. NBRC 109706]